MSLAPKSIGEVANEIGVSVHTLRYYEKINLITKVTKSPSGRRQYDSKAIEQIRFIKRAQKMQFSLDEIKQLLELDRSNSLPKPKVQSMVKSKLQQIDESLDELTLLKINLTSLLNSCESSKKFENCPILEKIKADEN